MISQTNSGSIAVTLSGVTDSDAGQILSYSYQWNGTGGTWINFSQTGSTPKANVTEALIASGTSLPDGNNTLYVRASDSIEYSNVISKAFQKDTQSPAITVTNPGTEYASSKTITATGSDANGVTLGYAISSNYVCNSSLSFTSYAPVVFSSTADNGKTVCFRAVDSFGNTSYASSSPISGMVAGRDVSAKTTPVKNSDLFGNYSEWRKGALRDFDPIYILIKSQISQTTGGTTGTGSTNSTYNYPNLITDVNGDGLPDLIVTNLVTRPESFVVNGTTIYSFNYTTSYGLLLNKGNMDYEATYRCVNYQSSAYMGNNGYYGDCAQ